MVEKTDQSHRWPSLFDPLYDPLRTFGSRVAEWLSPASEASSDDGSYAITMELPGVSDEDIELTVADGTLTIRGEKKTESERKGDTWYFSERQYGAFSRSFRLPKDADGSKAAAKMKDGVLNVRVPRLQLEDTKKATKISIAKS
jgi:HSP20 family protein